MARRAHAVQLAAFVVVLGIPDGALGVLWPPMRDSFDRPLGDLGYLAVASTVLYILGGVIFAAAHRTTPVQPLVWWSCAASAVAVAGWAAATAWAWLLLAIAAFGAARGVLDAAVNAGATGEIRRLGWLHAGWAAGGALGPLLVTALAGVGSWRTPVAVLAAAAAVIAVVGLPGRSVDAGTGREPAAAPPPRIPTRQLALVLGTFALYTAAEAGPIAWGYIYLTDDRGMATAAAAGAVAGFWVLVGGGRVALGVLGDRADPQRLLDRSCLLLAVGLGVFWLAPHELAVIGLPLAGLGSAAVFPLLIHLTPARLGRPEAGQVVGFSVAAAAVGGPLAVLVEGQLVDATTVASLGPALFAAAALLYALVRSLWRRPAARPDAAPGAAW